MSTTVAPAKTRPRPPSLRLFSRFMPAAGASPFSAGHGISKSLLNIPRRMPNLNLPRGNGLVDVRIINTTTYQRTSTENLIGPALHGHTTLNFPTYAFLIRHPREDINMLFDLGMRKDWERACPPSLRPYVSDSSMLAPLQVSVEQDITDVLEADKRSGGVGVNDISAVIWSSHLFDHRGDISMFPSHTKLIVGPNVRRRYSGCEIDAQEFEGREVVEMTVSDFHLEVGGFRAHDVFGDGSFYIMSCPGPTMGHLCALARVTLEPVSTFVFLGGDCAQHCGEFRPSPFMPLPEKILLKPAALVYNPRSIISAPVMRSRKTVTCAGEFIRDKIHPCRTANDSLYETPSPPLVTNLADANESLAKLELFDACPEVLVCISHDQSLMDVLPFYPYSLNNWYKKGYKQRLQWEFLGDFDLEEMKTPGIRPRLERLTSL